MSECREQMMKDCPMAKDGHCPMMDEMKGMGMKHGHGRVHRKGGMMNDGDESPEKE